MEKGEFVKVLNWDEYRELQHARRRLQFLKGDIEYLAIYACVIAALTVVFTATLHIGVIWALLMAIAVAALGMTVELFLFS